MSDKPFDVVVQNKSMSETVEALVLRRFDNDDCTDLLAEDEIIKKTLEPANEKKVKVDGDDDVASLNFRAKVLDSEGREVEYDAECSLVDEPLARVTIAFLGVDAKSGKAVFSKPLLEYL